MCRQLYNPNTIDAPYFLARKHKGEFETKGQSTATFGHRIDSPRQTVADGVFAGWCWNGIKLTAYNDRYGIFPLFWSRLPNGGVCVSSSLTRLIECGASRVLDYDALAVFFRLQTFVGNDTPFAAIKVLPPNAVFEWQDGELQCRERIPETPKRNTISRDDAIDQYIDLFAYAMAKRTPASDNFAVPVSGGRDSRHILLELHRMGIEPAICVSAWDNPPDPNEDPKIGNLLCSELGFRYAAIDQELSPWSAEIRKNHETHFCASAHGWYLALADYIKNRSDCIFDGLAGDVLSQSSNLNPKRDEVFLSGDVNAIANTLLFGSARPGPVLKGIINRKLQRAMAPEIARKRISKEVKKHLGMPNPTASFFFWNRTRRMTALAPYGLLSGMRRVHTPFLDHDLFDFMVTLPSSMLLDRTFHDDAIARAYPTFAHIPYANHKTAPRSDDQHIRRNFLSEAFSNFVLRRPSPLIKNVGPRIKILAGLLSRGHIHPWIPLSFVYLSQLEAVTNGQSGLQRIQTIHRPAKS